MSISAILNNAYTGLAASQANLRVISNNIANVNTENYARETVGLESLVAGGLGNGVRIAEVRRVADQFLEKAVHSARAESTRYEVLSQFHDRLQGLLGRPDSDASLPARLDSIFSSLADLSLDSFDVVRKAAVISDIQRFTDEMNKLADDVQQIRTDASNQIVDTVSNINASLKRIHELNPLIVKARLTGNDTAGLEQQRAQAIGRLTEFIDVVATQKSDGSFEVSTTTGMVLVDARLRAISYESPGVATPETTFAQIRITAIDAASGKAVGSSEQLDASIKSGKLRALLDIRDVTMPDLADGLGELALTFRNTLNAVHSQFTAAPPPRTVTGTNSGLLASDLHGFTGETTFAITDIEGKLVAKSVVNFNALPPGTTLGGVLATINAGLGGNGSASLVNGVFRLTAANPVHGAIIADGSGPASARGGRSFAQVFGINQLITSSMLQSPNTGLQASSAHGFTPGGTISFEVRDASNRIVGTADITVGGTTVSDLLAQLNNPAGLGAIYSFGIDANGALTATPAPAYKDITLRVVSDATARGATGVTLSDFFSLGHANQAMAAIDFKVNSDIVRNPSQLALAQFEHSVAPGGVAIGRGDNRGAIALRALESATVAFGAAGEIAGVQAKLSVYSGFLLGSIAVQADAAATAKDDSSVLYDNVLKRRDDFGGVNLDEELANMVVFQNSYSASARLMTAARDMYDALLSIAG